MCVCVEINLGGELKSADGMNDDRGERGWTRSQRIPLVSLSVESAFLAVVIVQWRIQGPQHPLPRPLWDVWGARLDHSMQPHSKYPLPMAVGQQSTTFFFSLGQMGPWPMTRSKRVGGVPVLVFLALLPWIVSLPNCHSFRRRK
jgi:hypothetical protein